MLQALVFGFLFVVLATFALLRFEAPGNLETLTPQPQLHGRFLHLTDLHPDMYYRANATARSSCHRHELDQLRKPKHMKRGYAGPWGAPATICDSPIALVDATFDWLAKNWANKLDFVIWTGDNARHDKDDGFPRTNKEIIEMNRMMAERFVAAFHRAQVAKGDKRKPSLIPIIPSIGNNDVSPNNVIGPGPNGFFDALGDVWAPFIPKKQQKTFRRGGYFVTEVIPDRLIVISLNTLYFYKANTAVHGCKARSEPGTEHIKWLHQVLERARKRGMKAYITGHVGPRRKHYTRSCYRKYGRLALKYHDVILGHHFGHSNMDHFFFIQSDAVRKKRSTVIMMDNYTDVTDNETDVMDDNETDVMDDNDIDNDDMWTFQRGADNEVRAELNAGRYMHRLLEHYRSVLPPNKIDADDYAVIHINPSVIPTFFPALRIYKYNTTEVRDRRSSESSYNHRRDPFDTDLWDKDEQDDIDSEDSDPDSDADLWTEFDDSEIAEERAKGQRRRKHDRNSAPHMNTFLTPLGYAQYYINLTKANLYPDVSPEYEIEYTTWEAYGMSDLTVPSYLTLARRAAKHGWKSKKLWRKMKDHLLVGTRSVLKERKDGGLVQLNGGDGSKGPLDYIESELSF